MKVKLSLGFAVNVDEDGRFRLPSDRKFTTTELKKMIREVNHQLRENNAEHILDRINEVRDE